VITKDYLISNMKYEKTTGVLSWIKSGSGRKMGAPAGSFAKDGYVNIYVCGKHYPAHRLVWFYFHGVFPTENIDHINGNKSDNRIENLREATTSQNCHNRGLPKNNTSGLKGIRYKKNRWEASISIDGKRKYLGRYKTKEEALNVYNDYGEKHMKEFFKKGEIL
jgi:hypothetical protein